MTSAMTTQPSSSMPETSRHLADRRGILFIISAPSGTGKTTLCKQLTSIVPGLWHSISYTTRKPRAGEEHGREYFFIGETEFQQMVDRNEFVEWARVYGHLYGTPRKTLIDQMEQGIDVLLEIDVQGRSEVKKKFEDAVSIFILPPSMQVLRSRLQNRASDTPEEILRRLQKVKEEVWSYREYAYVVRNEDLSQSLHELENVFLAERLKTKRLSMAWLEKNFILEDQSKSGDRKDLPSL